MSQTRQGKAAAANWARANRLAELSDVPAPTCRNYLTGVDEDQKELLDTDADKRNKHIRQMIEEVKQHTAPARRNAKGAPDRPARAGAPEKITTTKTEGTSIDLLIDIKKLADKHGGLDTIADGLNALKKLRD